jgi:ubiquinone/menaquinone biosynthesis C-methylase UbiE
MQELRTGRRLFYNVFSHFYDFFIKTHSGPHRDETRRFLVDSSQIHTTHQARVLDVCCGTGSVILAFAEKYAGIQAIGYDFSPGMLQKAREKDVNHSVVLVNGDAASLCFASDCFDVVCCSHALYELKGQARRQALEEMKRVIKPGGQVLIMEHEVPQKLPIKLMFYMRMFMMGPTDSREFIQQGLSPFERVFPKVSLAHTPSGKSKLIICQKI